MARTDRILRMARTTALTSEMKQKLGAVLVKGRRIIKAECNTPGKPKFIGSWSRHAEVRTTLNVNCMGGTVYIYREHGTLKSPLLARPCRHCIEWLQFVGIKEIVYTIPEYPYYMMESI